MPHVRVGSICLVEPKCTFESLFGRLKSRMKQPGLFRVHLIRSALRNLGLRSRLFLLIFPIMLGTVVFALHRMNEKMKISGEMEKVQKLTGVAVLSSSLIHELQKERGLGGLHLGKRTEESLKLYREQALITNSRIAVLSAFLKGVDLGRHSEEYRNNLDQALKKLAGLEAQRAAIGGGALSTEEELDYYTSTIDSLLRSIACLSRLSPSAEIQSLVSAYVNLLEFKERMGREQAVLATMFARGRFDAGLYEKFVALQAEKNIFQNNFRLFAGPADLDFFNTVLADPIVVEVSRLEKIAQQRDGGTSITADHWWRVASNQIDLLTGVEDRVSVRLSNMADFLKSEAERDLMLYLVVTLALVAAMAGFVWMLHRWVVRPILDLSQQMSHLNVHEIHRKSVHRNDEIGLLYRCFFEMSAELRQTLEGLEEAVKDRTNELNVLNNKLAKFLSPQLYQKIFSGTHDVTLTYTRKKLTVFFSDIVDFTGATDRMDPEELSGLLNFYLEEMSRIADRYEGTIDKFIGDAVMVFFGDPEFTSDEDHALRCVRMAQEMIERLKDLQDEWIDRGVTSPFRVRIGINTGYCTVGNFGSENRMDYTIIGNQVNLASRLQSHAGPGQILISQSTYALVKEKIPCVDRGEFAIKGFEHPVRAYEVSGVGEKESTNGRLRKTAAGFRLEVDSQNLSEGERREIRRALKQAFFMVSTDAEREQMRLRKESK